MDENSESRNLGRLRVAAAIISLIAAASSGDHPILQRLNDKRPIIFL